MPKQWSGKNGYGQQAQKGLSAPVAINCELGQSGNCSLCEHPEQDWNVQAIYHTLGGMRQLCSGPGNSSEGGGSPGKDQWAAPSYGPGAEEQYASTSLQALTVTRAQGAVTQIPGTPAKRIVLGVPCKSQWSFTPVRTAKISQSGN